MSPERCTGTGSRTKNLLLHHATLAVSTTPLAEPQSADPADVVSATWKAICRLDKIIESTRRQAQPLEAVYQAWVTTSPNVAVPARG